MGGLVVARTLAEQRRAVDAAVLSSPALGATPNWIQKFLLATLPRVLPHLQVDNGLEGFFIESDASNAPNYDTGALDRRSNFKTSDVVKIRCQ
jgi:alpha-beta hydrolase superfamily lysophospholipase